MVIAGTVSGGGYSCLRDWLYKGIAKSWGNDIWDQRWNAVSAHRDWIDKVLKGQDAEQCVPPKIKQQEQETKEKEANEK